MDDNNDNNVNITNNSGSISIPLGSEEMTMNTFSNAAFTDDVDKNNHSNSTQTKVGNSPVPQLKCLLPPRNSPPPLNIHKNLEFKRSNPPAMPPPLFQTPIPQSPTPLIDADDDEKEIDEDKIEMDPHVNYTIVENEKPPNNLHGILRPKCSNSIPNDKNVTFGKLPRRRGDPNPCVMLLVVITFLVAAIALLLVLLVIRGTIELTCDSNMSKHDTQAITHCPIGWIQHSDSCYGIVVNEDKQFSEAKSLCASNGGYILSLESKLEFDWFMKNVIYTRKKYDTSLGDILLGVKGYFNNGTMAWESLEKMNQWNSDLTSLGKDECLAISSQDASWKRGSCTENFDFYCERQAFS